MIASLSTWLDDLGSGILSIGCTTFSLLLLLSRLGLESLEQDFSTSPLYPFYRAYRLTCVLRYHLHYMVLAFGIFLIMFAGTYSTPITVNYITECFPDLALEVSTIMSVYRQVFGLSLPFFCESMESASRIWMVSQA